MARRVTNPREGQQQTDRYTGPTFDGLQDYGALKQRADSSYDSRDRQLNDPSQISNPFRTLDMAANTISRQSQWAPFLQALDEHGGRGRVQGGPSAPGSNQITGVSDVANPDSVADMVVQQHRPGAHAGPTNLGSDPNWWLSSDGPFKPTPDSLPPSLRPLFSRGLK